MNPATTVCSAPAAVPDDADVKDVFMRRHWLRWASVCRPLRGPFGAMQFQWLLPGLLAASIAGPLSVGAQSTPSGSRGELLYSTHCIGCHSTQVHWRDNKLATDWSTLRAQVRRWESNTGMNWSDDDIAAVASYLNDHYYRFPVAETTAALKRPSVP